MKQDKQKVVFEILNKGIYEVDIIEGKVYANRKRGKVLLKTNKLPTGYHQMMLFKGRHTGVKEIVYLHQIIYMARYGMYDSSKQIDHINGDRDNNSITNLRLVDISTNTLNLQKPKVYPKVLRLIRSEQIEQIKHLLSLGYSQSSIARQLNLNRLSVRYIIKRIEQGYEMKYA